MNYSERFLANIIHFTALLLPTLKQLFNNIVLISVGLTEIQTGLLR